MFKKICLSCTIFIIAISIITVASTNAFTWALPTGGGFVATDEPLHIGDAIGADIILGTGIWEIGKWVID